MKQDDCSAEDNAEDKGNRVTWSEPVVTEEWIEVKRFRGKNKRGKN
jgi:hypothetical protein